jgi:hypothetical protein
MSKRQARSSRPGGLPVLLLTLFGGVLYTYSRDTFE